MVLFLHLFHITGMSFWFLLSIWSQVVAFFFYREDSFINHKQKFGRNFVCASTMYCYIRQKCVILTTRHNIYN